MADFYESAEGEFRLQGPGEQRWREPQIGALGATIAHWSLGEREPTLISIPTGTGKTAVAMAAPFLASKAPGRVLVLSPSQAIRRQLTENFRSQAQLKALGVLPGELEPPSVLEMSGRATDWGDLAAHDVVVALPNSVSPLYYEEAEKPPRDLFDMVIIDEAHHSPASTWESVLTHFEAQHRLLLTATPTRRDGKAIPGSLEYYYPLRRALEQGFYKPVEPILLPVPAGQDRASSDAAIAARAAHLLGSGEHATSVLLVRGGSIKRLAELRDVYAAAGIELTLLHNGMGDKSRQEVIAGLRGGEIRAVGVVGMLGEGFDLAAIRLVAYHDKHRSVPATVQLIGRLARVDSDYPQPSALITVADAEVYPELKGVLRALYDEDADWATVLPGILDEEIEREQLDREFVDRFPASQTEIDAGHLQPMKRALIYEVPSDWEPPFLTELPAELELGAHFEGGSIAYVGTDTDAGMLVVVVRYVERPKWSSDPALTNVAYALHVIAHRSPPEAELPGLVMLNLASDGLRKEFVRLLGLEGVGERMGPERLGEYLDSLKRISVSSVGVRSTAAAARGRATYRNYMGGDVDRGMRAVDLTQSALGHVMLQVNTDSGTANAGAAIEKAKIWLSRYEPLRSFSEWVDGTSSLIWYPDQETSGRLLPGMDRGRKLDHWPDARPLAAEMFPALFGQGYVLWRDGTQLGALEDLALYVNEDPTGALGEIEGVEDERLRIVGVFEDRAAGSEECVWEAALEVDGVASVAGHDLTVQHGYGHSKPLGDLLAENPPTIYFLDGTTTMGAVRYERVGAAELDLTRFWIEDWTGTEITAETVATAIAHGNGLRSIHEQMETYLRERPQVGTSRWILKNDGSGEIADYVVVEALQSGEIELGLWHAKGSGSLTTSVRIGDCQVVVAQALRSRRWLTSSQLFSELAGRFSAQLSPVATLVEGSDPAEELRRHLGLEEPEEGFTPWTVSRPAVRGLIAVVQPGLSISRFAADLNLEPAPASSQAVRELFTFLSDQTTSDGAKLVVLASE